MQMNLSVKQNYNRSYYNILLSYVRMALQHIMCDVTQTCAIICIADKFIDVLYNNKICII